MPTLTYNPANNVFFSETNIKMLEFFNDNIFVMFGERVFQHTVGISRGTNCCSYSRRLFLYSYEVDFIHGLLKKNEMKHVRSLNLRSTI
jgi:hypothetical protein